jgi:hypothetical protein
MALVYPSDLAANAWKQTAIRTWPAKNLPVALLVPMLIACAWSLSASRRSTSMVMTLSSHVDIAVGWATKPDDILTDPPQSITARSCPAVPAGVHSVPDNSR